jgi:hypothetical protein
LPIINRRHPAIFAALLALQLPACAPNRPVAPSPAMERTSPAGFPQAYYEQAAARGEPVYRIDARQSLVAIEVRRGGSLARLGHDHVVAARNIVGYVAPAAGRADLYIVLDELVVDEAGLRHASGFDTQPSESDIAGTRANMLNRVLEAEKFPHALVRIGRADTEGKLTVSLTLHGITRELEVPARLSTDGDRVSMQGRLAFNQTDFSITPFSILGGAIQVQDRLELQFDIQARASR